MLKRPLESVTVYFIVPSMKTLTLESRLFSKETAPEIILDSNFLSVCEKKIDGISTKRNSNLVFIVVVNSIKIAKSMPMPETKMLV